MMWTAEIQILNKDMIVAVVIAIANKPEKKKVGFICNCLNCNFLLAEVSNDEAKMRERRETLILPRR